MDLEFHYYINYIIALKAGFNTDYAYKIAYSAQYVDDNRDIQAHSCITQSYRILSQRKTTEQIYFCFHFVPADIDLKVKANDNISADMLQMALKYNNPYAIGIASHVYADSWAHQNFVGRFDANNASNQFGAQLIPNIGHADFGHKPDMINLKWYDDRIKQQISNKQRFMQAAECLYHHYCNSTGYIHDKHFIRQLDSLINEETEYLYKSNIMQKERIKEYKLFAKRELHHIIPVYDAKKWWYQKKNKLSLGSDWYQFQQQAEIYKQKIWEKIKVFMHK